MNDFLTPSATAGGTMLDKVHAMVQEMDSCVLATASENHPHCSLMAYVASPDSKKLYLVTSRSTRKYNNISRNPKISLLMDTRGSAGARSDTMALTIDGQCASMAEGAEKQTVLQRFRDQHPNLTSLLDHPDMDILEVVVETALLLIGAQESHFERISQSRREELTF